MKTKITSLSLCFAIVDEEIHFMELKMLICISSMMWKGRGCINSNHKYECKVCVILVIALRVRVSFFWKLLSNEESDEISMCLTCFASVIVSSRFKRSVFKCCEYCDEAIFETMWQHFVWTSMFWLGTTRWEIK